MYRIVIQKTIRLTTALTLLLCPVIFSMDQWKPKEMPPKQDQIGALGHELTPVEKRTIQAALNGVAFPTQPDLFKKFGHYYQNKNQPQQPLKTTALQQIQTPSEQEEQLQQTINLLRKELEQKNEIIATLQNKIKSLEEQLELMQPEEQEESISEPQPINYYQLGLRDHVYVFDDFEENLDTFDKENKEDIKKNIEIAREMSTKNLNKDEKAVNALFNATLRLLFYVKPSNENEVPSHFNLRIPLVEILYKIYEPAMTKHQRTKSPATKLPLFEQARAQANGYEKKLINKMEQDVNWVPLSMIQAMGKIK